MMALLVVIVVLDSLILLGIVIGLYIVLRSIGKVAEAAEAAIEEFRRELVPVLEAAHDALRGIETLAARSEKQVERLGDVLRSVDRVASGAAVAEAAVTAFRSTRNTAATIVAALREGLRAFAKPAGDVKED